MGILRDKPLSKPATTTKESGKMAHIPAHAIKLKVVTTAERQRLRISSYQYLLP